MPYRPLQTCYVCYLGLHLTKCILRQLYLIIWCQCSKKHEKIQTWPLIFRSVSLGRKYYPCLIKHVLMPFASSWENWYLSIYLKASMCSNTFLNCGLISAWEREVFSSCLLTFLTITAMPHLTLQKQYAALLPGEQVNLGSVYQKEKAGTYVHFELAFGLYRHSRSSANSLITHFGIVIRQTWINYS